MRAALHLHRRQLKGEALRLDQHAVNTRITGRDPAMNCIHLHKD